MQSEAVKDMPETIELGYFYIGAPMSEYFYSVIDDETRLQGMQPLRKAVYVRQEAAQSPASGVEVVTVGQFEELMAKTPWDSLAEDGIFLADMFPNGLKIVKSLEGV